MISLLPMNNARLFRLLIATVCIAAASSPTALADEPESSNSDVSPDVRSVLTLDQLDFATNRGQQSVLKLPDSLLAQTTNLNNEYLSYHPAISSTQG